MAYAAQQTTYNPDGSVVQQRVAGTTQSGGGIEGFLHNHHKLAGLGAGILAYEGAEKYQEAEGERPHRFEDAMIGLAAGVGTNAAINHYTGGQGQQQQGGYPQQQQQGYYQGGPPPQQQQPQGGGMLSNFMHSGVGMTAMGGAAAFGGYELYEHEKHKHEREREQEFLAGERFEEQQQQQEYGREVSFSNPLSLRRLIAPLHRSIISTIITAKSIEQPVILPRSIAQSATEGLTSRQIVCA